MNAVKTRKRNTTAAIAVIALPVIIALTGTFAWQSISQEALNENTKVVNPGGRLHDDFDGKNKSIYAENFAKEDLIVRVQIREYMEIGKDAGKDKTGTSRKVEPVDDGKKINEPENWTIHTMESCTGKIHDYVNLLTGGQTVYLPTFNKNKDSLKADINGTFEKKFEDYTKYTDGQSITKDEIYDADTNGVEEEPGVEGTNIKTVSGQAHQTKKTLNGNVITMSQWKTQGSKLGDYWVYDTDGWAYWANPLKPDTATGLLINKVDMKKRPSNNWYYGIDVTGQFVTFDDLGEKDNTGFYADGKTPTEDAKTLLKAIVDTKKDNVLTETKSKEIREKLQSGSGDVNKTVSISGTDFYVLHVDDAKNQALLLTKEVYKNSPFNGSSVEENKAAQWKDSNAQKELQKWLKTKPTLDKAAVPVTLNTRVSYVGEDSIESIDKAFLLSEADVLGTIQGGKSEAKPKDYTLGVEREIVPESLKIAKIGGADRSWWLRNPHQQGAKQVAAVTNGTIDYWSCTSSYGLRPAVIVRLTPASR